MKRFFYIVVFTSLLCLSSCGKNTDDNKSDKNPTTSGAGSSFVISWKNYNGNVLDTETYEYGQTPSYKKEQPTRASDNQYNYTFSGWTPEIVPVTSNTNYIATYSKNVRSYQIIWKNYDGTVLDVETYEYGQTPSYKGATPIHESSEQYTYRFSGWSPSIDTVTSETTYTARFSSELQKYTITWKNYDGTVLDTETYAYGQTPTFKKGTPKREKDADCYYVFNGWEGGIKKVTKNTEYIASFSHAYEITWKNYDGEVLKTDIVVENKMPSYTGTTPVKKDQNGTYLYTFNGWTEDIVPATKNTEYIASFTESVGYTFTFNGRNGYILTGCLLTDSKCLTIPNEYEGFGVLEIAASALANLQNVENIVISNSVKTIGDLAFSNCNNLKSIYIPNNVTSIGKNILKGCNCLESLSIPYVGSSPSDSKFLGFFFGNISQYSENYKLVPQSLKDVVILDGCKTIASYAFAYCQLLSSITIPSTVTSIGDYAFYQCLQSPALVINIYTYFAAIKENTFFSEVMVCYHCSLAQWSTIEGRQYLKNYDVIFDEGDDIVDLVIPYGRTEIKDYEFFGCRGITSITIPETVTKIGVQAFANCDSLESLVVPETVTQLGNSFLKGCTSLKSLTLPFIGPRASSGDSLKYFFGNSTVSSLKTLVVLDTCQAFSKAVFQGWELESITVPFIGELRNYPASGYIGRFYSETITDYSLSTTESQRNRNVPSTLKEIRLSTACTKLQDYAFANTGNNLTIYVPNSVTSFGKDSFKNCTSKLVYHGTLGEWLNIDVSTSTAYRADTHLYLDGNEKETEIITFPDSITSLRDYAFAGCSGLTTVNIHSTLTDIALTAFQRCNASINFYGSFSEWLSIAVCSGTNSNVHLYLDGQEQPTSSFVFSNDMTSLPDYAFYQCTDLTSINIPSSVTSIGKNAFYGCSNLESVTITDSAQINASFFTNCDSLKDFYYYGSTENWLKFAYKNYINENIHYHLFLDGSETESTTFVFPEDTKTIDSYALYNCKSLKTIVVPESVTSINSGAFNGCSSLETISLPFVGASRKASGESALFGSIFGKSSYEGSVEIKQRMYVMDNGWNNPSPTYLPASLKNVIINGDSDIGINAFNYCSPIKTITLTGNIEKIRNWSFRGCSSLTTVNIESNITQIFDYAFEGCGSLKNINLPASLTTIGNSVFEGCYSLEHIDLPASLTTIGSAVFKYCSTLKTIVIPEGIQAIEPSMFYYCTSLESIYIPNSVTQIKTSAFDHCTSLRTIEIPNSVTSIGDKAFYYCSSLEPIAFSSSLSSIGKYAFEGCGWREITIPHSMTLGSNAFDYATFMYEKLSIRYTGTAKGWMTMKPNGAFDYANVHFFFSNSEEESTTFVVPNKTTNIRDYCFRSCSSLVSIVIPNSVVSIGENVFWGCDSLRYVFYQGSKYDYSMIDINTNCGYDISLVYFYSETAPSEAGNYWHYVDDVPTIW